MREVIVNSVGCNVQVSKVGEECGLSIQFGLQVDSYVIIFDWPTRFSQTRWEPYLDAGSHGKQSAHVAKEGSETPPFLPKI